MLRLISILYFIPLIMALAACQHLAQADKPVITKVEQPNRIAKSATPAASVTAAGHQTSLNKLIELYGPEASSGMGSAVFSVKGKSADTLQFEAMAVYKRFVGDGWARSPSGWEAGFKELFRRAPGDVRGIDAELHALQPPDIRGIVQMMVDEMEDPAAARAVLAEAFDAAEVDQLRLFSLGDGEQMSGVQIAATYKNGDAIFLVLLLD